MLFLVIIILVLAERKNTQRIQDKIDNLQPINEKEFKVWRAKTSHSVAYKTYEEYMHMANMTPGEKKEFRNAIKEFKNSFNLEDSLKELSEQNEDFLQRLKERRPDLFRK